MESTVIIELMNCVNGTTTSSDALCLFIQIDNALSNGSKIKISLLNSTPMSSSFLNASFGEIFDKYGYNKIKENISLINYKPSQAQQIKNYLEEVNKLAH